MKTVVYEGIFVDELVKFSYTISPKYISEDGNLSGWPGRAGRSTTA
ncbi:MAG: hypothetical protein O3C43_12255 [Verrucomicrobia bacterium]|nr:hypothetical protein [Verrucomicrobiota bacterium]MDA1067265.1 hypothetical protein [Verrucomicrobiota bacterium]